MNKFVCQRCGRCCGIVPFEKKEYNAIRKIAQQRHIGFVKQDLNGETVYFPKSALKALNNVYNACLKNGDISGIEEVTCPFLEYEIDGKAKCTIYEFRPKICRIFGNGGHPCLVCPYCSNFAEGKSFQSRYFAKKNAIKNWNTIQEIKEKD